MRGWPHVPDAVQRATLLRRAGTYCSHNMDPGLAAHHAAHAARRAASEERYRKQKRPGLSPRPLNFDPPI